MPKLPFQVPKTLINRMPNQPLRSSELFSIFSKLTAQSALPLVALPAIVLSVTVASPLFALQVTSLLICPLTLLLIVALLLTLVLLVLLEFGPVLDIPPPSSAAVVPGGAFKIRPTHLPLTFTNTNMSLAPTTRLPVRLKAVMVVLALPLAALPALVLSLTVAAPLTAVPFTVLLIPRLLVLVTLVVLLTLVLLVLVELGPVMVTVGTLSAISSSTKFGGSRMSPFRLPLMLMVPTNDFPAVRALSIMLMTLAIPSALPLVALPPLVLSATVALPLAAAIFRLLFMPALTLLLTVRLLLTLVLLALVLFGPVP